MRKLGFWLMVCGLTIFGKSAQAQIFEGLAAEKFLSGCELVRYTDRTPLPNFFVMRPGMEIPAGEIPQLLQKVYRLGESGSLQLGSLSDDALGFVHQKLQQTQNGFEVEGGELTVHLRNGGLHSVSGDAFPVSGLANAPAISPSAALKAATDAVGATQYRWEDENENRFLRFETGDPMATWYPTGTLVYAPQDGLPRAENYRLAWKFDIYAIQPLYRAWVYVDAVTGEVIWEHNRIHTADVLGSAVTRYSGTQAMTADQVSGNSYRLRETGRGNGIQTFNLQTGTNYGTAVDFTDANNVWSNVNPQEDEVATDAHWGAEKTYDFFWTSFNRNSINGQGFMLKSYVHYDNNYNNAFWDGQRMTYGDGNGTTFTPLTAIDVTGHEITHGLTTFTADLVYQNESGALNESFSDIFGNCIEHYARPNDWSWRIGEDMTPNGNGIRSMQTPGTFGDPDTYNGTNWYSGTGDNGGVHTNSGVQNKWFYILTIGETGTNDIGSAYNVTGQGWTKSAAIAFRNLTVYLGSASEYLDARFYAIRSAIDLYGACTPEVIATTNAWYAVGVGPAFTNTVLANFTASPTTLCSAPSTVAFSNSSVNAGSFTWNFGDGGTSTLSAPTHTYNTLGTFNVSLIANAGTCGIDTLLRTAYIVLDTNLGCNIILSPTNTNSTQTACSGTLFDSGGPTANYGANTNSIITIAPAGASQVNLSFASFAMEANYDYLYVYDGPTIGSPLIGTYTGTNIPGNISSTGGAITLRQSTDPLVDDTGFEIQWSCVLPNAAPAANFSADNLTSCNGVVNFRDLSTNGPNAWLWNFGDGFTSNLQHPSHTYQANGTYTVTLTATNNIGANTITRTAYITVNRPAGPVSSGASRCGPGTVTLSATGSGTLKWYDQASGGTVLGTGTTFTTPSLTNSLVFYVEAETQAPVQAVGPLTPAAVGAGGYHNNTSIQYLAFTVSSNMTLVSFYVDPGAAGNRTISLWDGAGTLLRDTVINIGANPSRITLNWTMAPGQYRIGGTEMDLYRNNAGANFPYSIANFVSITGSSAGAAFYYYFYDWDVQGLPCLSERTPVPVTIEQEPVANFSVATNLFTSTFTDLSTGNPTAWAWTFGDGGTSVLQNPTHTYAANGTYNVTLVASNGTNCDGTTTDTVNIAVVGIDAGWDALWNGLSVSPNPFGNDFRVQMNLPIGGQLNIGLFDLQGKALTDLYSGEVNAGQFKLDINELQHKIAAGTYLVRFEFGDAVRCLRVVKMN
ncbi:MAG: M4 family metallopeptidase [Bacteroidetes bacterium]|nr:M4 family metallopeptidase [Bacteroidota bacterium]